jgi:hypothetical protein
MAILNLGKLSNISLNAPVLEALGANSPDKATVSNALNTALKAVLTNSATNTQQTALADLLQTLSSADLAAEQNLSLRDFVAKHTTLPTDPAAKRAAEAAIATLSSTTTVGPLLGLNSTVASNPVLAGTVANKSPATCWGLRLHFPRISVQLQSKTDDFPNLSVPSTSS